MILLRRKADKNVCAAGSTLLSVRRWLFNLAAAVSLMVCVAVVLLWV
jgi:hypothetical protein